jgi:hypothetical protein
MLMKELNEDSQIVGPPISDGAIRQSSFQHLFDGLLGVEPQDLVRGGWIRAKSLQHVDVLAALRNRISACSRDRIEYSPLPHRLIEHGVRRVSPVLESPPAHNEDIDRNPQWSQDVAQPDRFFQARRNFRFDHKHIQVAIVLGVAAGPGAEDDDCGSRRRLLQQLYGLPDRRFVDHDFLQPFL